ncbi:MAG: DUF4981 domain-containing protein, partial [Bacteroidales bacterium]|nr:DUF4981 domain-containing protein [Bacteroidales bacterium]
EKGTEFWAYGGDYGEGMPSDENFVCNGIISADLNPQPALWEVKYAYRNVSFQKEGDGYRISNLHDFIDLSNYEIGWTLSGNGKKLYSGVLENFNLEPRSDILIADPVPGPNTESRPDIPIHGPSSNLNLEPGVEYFIDFSVRLKKAKPFRPAGFEVAHEQFKLSDWQPLPAPEISTDALVIKESGDILEVTGINFVIRFDKTEGILSSYEINGFELFREGPRPNFWRPPNDNDKGSNMLKRLGIWREVSNEAQPSSFESSQPEKGLVLVEVQYDHEKVNSKQTVTYKILGDGTIDVITRLETGDSDLPDLPRFGLRWELPVSFDNLEYFGRGPHENYIDRNRSAFVGLYEGKVTDQYYKYVRPQENGYKTGVRWFNLRNENGVGIRVSGNPIVGFSALHNPLEDFDMLDENDFRHTNDIVKKDGVFICCDLKMMGVAGDNSWGARPYPEYSIPAKDYQFSFTLKPVF